MGPQASCCRRLWRRWQSAFRGAKLPAAAAADEKKSERGFRRFVLLRLGGSSSHRKGVLFAGTWGRGGPSCPPSSCSSCSFFCLFYCEALRCRRFSPGGVRASGCSRRAGPRPRGVRGAAISGRPEKGVEGKRAVQGIRAGVPSVVERVLGAGEG